VPYADARVINISRRAHPDLETVQADLSDPSTWPMIAEHFRSELATFTGERALFIANANLTGSGHFAGEDDEQHQVACVLANVAAPLVLADAFVRACRPGFEAGVVMMSSAGARVALEGDAVYCAAKAAVEQWAKVVRKERIRRGVGPWIIAVRPGLVDTPAARQGAEMGIDQYPPGPATRRALEAGEAFTSDEAARNIWDALPPTGNESVLLFGEVPEGIPR
jgi:benzil reductase ((S)-benzoin forming)